MPTRLFNSYFVNYILNNKLDQLLTLKIDLEYTKKISEPIKIVVIQASILAKNVMIHMINTNTLWRKFFEDIRANDN